MYLLRYKDETKKVWRNEGNAAINTQTEITISVKIMLKHSNKLHIFRFKRLALIWTWWYIDKLFSIILLHKI